MLENITLGELVAALAFLTLLAGSVLKVIKGLKKAINGLFKEQLAEINKRFDSTDKAIKKIDLENCKNFLVQTLSAADKGEKLTTEERMRLAEEFEHYSACGGNSYIKDWHSRLKREKKI